MTTISNKYRLLKVPFVSKKKIEEILATGKKGGKYSFSGNAYYVIDTTNYCIVWERAILTETEYRPTDSDMLVTSHYENYYINKNIDRNDIMGWCDESYEVKVADDEILRKINDYVLMNTSTVLSIEGVISGSNPTGSDSTISNSPILIDPRLEVDYYRFVNAIKRIRCHDKTINNVFKEYLNVVDDIENIFWNQITLEELIEKNDLFGKWMKVFNSDIAPITDDQEEMLEYLNSIKNNDIQNSVAHAIAMFENKMIEENKLITKLRREFRISLLKEAIENHFTEYTGNETLSIYDTEAAHILGVSEIKKFKLDFNWIANPNNGLLISPELHTILDKKKVLLKEDGTFEGIDSDYKDKVNNKIKEVVLNEERKEFIKLRNEYLWKSQL